MMGSSSTTRRWVFAALTGSGVAPEPGLFVGLKPIASPLLNLDALLVARDGALQA
jgi:hypothetical protein